MAWVLSELDQYEQSMNYLKQAVDLSHKEFGEQSSTSPLAQTYAVAATVYERCNMNDKALSFFKRSLELFQTIFGNGPIPGYLPLLTKLENLEIALEHARKLCDGKPHFILAVMLKNLGNASLSEKSLEYFQEGKEMMDELLGPNHAHAVTSGILNSMGVVYRDVYGDLSKSFQCLQDALTMNSVVFGEDSTSDCTGILNSMGVVYRDVYGDLSKSFQCLQDALTMNSVVFGEDSTSDCSEAVYQNIGFTAQQMGNLSEAKDYFIEVVKIRRKLPITKDTCEGFVSALYHITSICETLGEQDDALKFLEEARDVAKAGGYNDWDVVYILLKLI